MRAFRTAEKTIFRTTADSVSSRAYVCRSCQLHAARQFHSLHQRYSEQDVSFMRRLRDTIFGSKETKAVEASREKKQQQQLDELQTQDPSVKEVKVGADGRSYEVAALVDPSKRSDYIPASTWEQLERVGGAQWVRSRQDQGEQYKGFMTSQLRKHLTDDRLKLILFHISVEILALYSTGRDLSEFTTKTKKDEIERYGNVEAVRNSVIVPAEGGLGVRFESDEQQARVLESLSRKDTSLPDDVANATKDASRILTAGPVESLQQYQNNGLGHDAWLNLSIQDPTVKLAVIKRLVQLTGVLGDNFLGNATSMGGLFNALKKRPQAVKLLQDEQVMRIAQRIPNVTIQPKQRLIDRETQVGRWKLIEEELNKRDLPVPAARAAPRSIRI